MKWIKTIEGSVINPQYIVRIYRERVGNDYNIFLSLFEGLDTHDYLGAKFKTEEEAEEAFNKLTEDAYVLDY